MQRDKKKRVFLLLIALLVLLLAAVAIYLVVRHRPSAKQAGGLTYEQNVVIGDLPGKTQEERLSELASQVEEGMISISINATPSTSLRQGGKVNWVIDNPSNQGKLIRVEVFCSENGEKIYETGALRPGSYIEAAPLLVELPVGEYPCTAYFYSYREESEEYIGKAAAQIVLTVLE